MAIRDAILATLDAQHGPIAGRTLLQKKLYFLGVLVKEEFAFSPHYYGPYSAEIAEQLSALVDTGFVDEREEVRSDVTTAFGNARRYAYQLSALGQEVIEVRSAAFSDYTDALGRINSDPTANDPFLLPVAAKVHFIVAESGKASVADIKRRAGTLGWDISEASIQKVADYLGKLGLVRAAKAR